MRGGSQKCSAANLNGVCCGPTTSGEASIPCAPALCMSAPTTSRCSQHPVLNSGVWLRCMHAWGHSGFTGWSSAPSQPGSTAVQSSEPPAGSAPATHRPQISLPSNRPLLLNAGKESLLTPLKRPLFLHAGKESLLTPPSKQLLLHAGRESLLKRLNQQLFLHAGRESLLTLLTTGSEVGVQSSEPPAGSDLAPHQRQIMDFKQTTVPPCRQGVPADAAGHGVRGGV